MGLLDFLIGPRLIILARFFAGIYLDFEFDTTIDLCSEIHVEKTAGWCNSKWKLFKFIGGGLNLVFFGKHKF